MSFQPFSDILQKNVRDQFFTSTAPEVIDPQIPMQLVGVVGYNFDSGQSLYMRPLGLAMPASEQTLISSKRQGVGTGSTFFTVTSGKTFYCLGVFVANNGVAGTFNIGNGTGFEVSGFLPVGGVTTMSGGVIFTVPSGTAVLIAHGFGGALAFAHIWGYEA